MPSVTIERRNCHDARRRDVRVQSRGIAKPTRNRARFSSIPTASGAITRAAYAQAVEAGLDVEPLLNASGLSVRQVENSNFRIAVKNQIKFFYFAYGGLRHAHTFSEIDLPDSQSFAFSNKPGDNLSILLLMKRSSHEARCASRML